MEAVRSRRTAIPLAHQDPLLPLHTQRQTALPQTVRPTEEHSVRAEVRRGAGAMGQQEILPQADSLSCLGAIGAHGEGALVAQKKMQVGAAIAADASDAGSGHKAAVVI